MREFLAITKALSDRNRVRILIALGACELCVCQIIEMVGLAPSTISKHMAVLDGAQLVESRKDGRWVYYRLPDPMPSPAVAEAIQWACRSLKDDPQVARDAGRLNDIRKMDKNELCSHYGRK